MDPFRFKLRLTVIVTTMAFAGMLVRLCWVAQPGNLDLPQWKTDVMPSLRGAILDRHGSYLALTVTSSSVFLRPYQFKNAARTVGELSRATGLAEADIKRRIAQGTRQFVWLIRQVDEATGRKVRALKLPGVEVTSEPRRVYPHNSLAAHLIGFAGVDHLGLTGAEKGFDKVLLPGKPPHDEARNLVLTIDLVAQYVVEEELATARQATGARRTLGVVYQPQTGEVLAMAASPSFDPNAFRTYRQEVFINPNLSLAYEPGSTMKVFTAAFLAANRLVGAGERFLCEGKIKVYDHVIDCGAAHGRLTLPEIIKHSCNVGVVRMAERINRRKFHDFLANLGFGAATGLGVPGESAGTLRPAREWSGMSRAVIPIGYELSVTPLQLVAAAGAVATGGLLFRPHVVKAVTDWQGRVLEAVAPQETRRVFGPAVARDLLRMLRAVVTDGTGRQADVPGLAVGGKTGTAHVSRGGGRGYDESRYNASFLGFVPAGNTRLVVLVVVQDPSREHMGGTAAAPVFARIAGRLAEYFGKRGDGR